MMQKATVFYTTILFSLKQHITNEVPTAAVDGVNLFVNPEFFMNLNPNERISLLCHEVLHVALDHMHRRGDRDAIVMGGDGQPVSLWNVAGDYVINQSLKEGGYILPPNPLLNSNYRGKSTDQVYDLLYKKSEENLKKILVNCGPGSMNGGDVQYPDPTSKDPQVTQDQVTKIILRASTQAKAMGQPPGSVPGEVEIELQRTLNPPLPWYVILKNHLTDFAKDDYSFRRPNRRFLPDYYLPTAHSEAIPNIAVFVDASGSVRDNEFNSFITHIDNIITAMQPKETTVVAFDTAIKSEQKLLANDNPFTKLVFHGRGGTRIQPVHEWIQEKRPTLAIIFTDGQFTQTKPLAPDVPLFWVINNNPQWKNKVAGQTIHYDIDP